MHLRAARNDGQRVALGAHADEAALEAEQPQEVNEIGLEEALPAEVRQLIFVERQAAQVVDLVAHLRR